MDATGAAACEKTLGTIDRMAPTLVESVISQLMLREATRHLVGQAQCHKDPLSMRDRCKVRYGEESRLS